MELSSEERHQLEFGPLEFAMTWLRAVGRDDIDVVWPAMTADLRLAFAQHWISENPDALKHPSAELFDRDEFARLLSVEYPEHLLFPYLATVSLRGIRSTYGDLDVTMLAPGLRARPIGPDLELVRLFYLPDLSVNEAGEYTLLTGSSARCAPIITLSTRNGWRVAGMGVGYLRPGWPPHWETVISPDD